jgi:ABC-type glycerol-3-phosphate transport system substrate-binding protein
MFFRLAALSAFCLLAALTACSRLLPGRGQTSLANGTSAASPTVTRPLGTVTRRPPTSTPAPTPVVTSGVVTLWHSLDETEIPALVEMIADFQSRYPDVLFDVLYTPASELQNRYATAVRDGEGPAILIGPAAWGPPLHDAGQLADLKPLASPELIASLNPAGVSAATDHDALIGLPISVQGVVLYRNIRLIPEPPKTFKDLVTLARAATVGDTVGAILDRQFFFSGGHLGGLGGSWTDPDGNPAFNNPQGLAWVEMLRAFVSAGPLEAMGERDADLFKAGRAGMILDGSWNRDALAKAIGGDERLAIDPWPVYENNFMSGFVQADNLYLNPNLNARDQQAAWKFIQHMLSPASQARLAAVGRIPAIRDEKTVDPIKYPLINQAVRALAGGTAYPPYPQMKYYPAALDAALKAIFEKNTKPAEALKAAEDAILQAMAGPTPTPTPTR